ncbi:hypothetical protein CkaCkLH20_08881 [Colletotrichum karsti]|uniref:BTB domain-containing protein n=1 Tax=Colletotrichum karsti TaxID=1095194 RepID=A0A9P6I4C8_9PEZI|nr:uncharacterized protein CkaCkLH20_08881 [Colletotrichum karsti]KAF9873771.1 hypothetical protein CkaCkLH20_08881 [Colletotrichum karsti]
METPYVILDPKGSEIKTDHENEAQWKSLKMGSPNETVYLEDSGDLTLVVGGDLGAYDTGDATADDGATEIPDASRRFVVCSKTMKRVFEVFRKMLFPTFAFAESKPVDEPWVVHLPEDAPEPMFIMLSYAHGLFSNIPRTLSLVEIREVLFLTNKYLFTQHMDSIVEKWLRPYRGSVVLDRWDQYQMAGIAWELGDKVLFEGISLDLARHCLKITRSDAPDLEGLVLRDEYFPEGSRVVSWIDSYIERFLSQLNAKIDDGIQKCSEGTICSIPQRQKPRRKVWPEPQWYDCTERVDLSLSIVDDAVGITRESVPLGSVHCCYNTLDEIYFALPRNEMNNLDGHDCFPFQEMMDLMTDAVYSPADGSRLDIEQSGHLDSQARISGWNNPEFWGPM